MPPRSDGAREGLRILLAAHAQATTARTAAVNILKAFLLGAPDNLRQALRGLSTPPPGPQMPQPAGARQPVAEQILRAELRRLATDIGVWDRELRANKAQLRQLVAQVMPGQPGVGPMSAAQLMVSWSHPGRFRSQAAFAAPGRGQPAGSILRQDHPAPAQPFGDRQLNRAVHVIVNWRMLHHPGTRVYLARRAGHGRARNLQMPQTLGSSRPLSPHGNSRQDLTAHRSVMTATQILCLVPGESPEIRERT